MPKLSNAVYVGYLDAYVCVCVYTHIYVHVSIKHVYTCIGLLVIQDIIFKMMRLLREEEEEEEGGGGGDLLHAKH